MIAANNIMNALFMVAGAAAAATLAALGLSAPAVLHVAAVANLARRDLDRSHPAARGVPRAAALVLSTASTACR